MMTEQWKRNYRNRKRQFEIKRNLALLLMASIILLIMNTEVRIIGDLQGTGLIFVFLVYIMLAFETGFIKEFYMRISKYIKVSIQMILNKKPKIKAVQEK
jgi:hypothetical protein